MINYEELNRKEFVCFFFSENKLEDEWETNPKNEDPFLYLNNFDEPLDTDFDFDFSINNFPLESFIDENLGQVLKFFINHFSCNAELCSLTALSFLKCKKEFDHSYFYMLCYFYIFEQLKKTAIFDIPFEILTNSNIFNPRITIFDFQMLSKNIDSFNSQSIIGDDFNNINKNENDSNWPLINSLRSKILEIIINSSLIDYQRFLQSLFQYPLLFAETLYRLSKIEMSLSYEKGAMFIDLIFNANSFYSSFYKSKNELIKNINGIRIAKQAIFHFLEHILQNDVNLRMFFSDNEFVIGISSLIFEKSLRPFLLKLFCLYPHSSEFDSLHCDVVNQIKVIFGKVFKHLDKIEYVDETNELLKFINRVIPQNIKTVDIFMTIISPLCLNLFKLPKDNECSVALINNVFELLINCSNSYTLTSSDILALESTISKIIIIDENLVNSLTRIILGRKHEQIDTSMNNLIELKQPGVVRTMINIFYNTPYMNSVLSLINKLCQSSDYNKVKMSTNEIDICLIHLLEKYRDLNNSNDNSNNEIIFDTINILLMEISKHCSSVSVVQSFIQLFCLDNGKTLPNFHEKTLKTFLSLVSCPPENDSIVIPFDNSNEFTINQVKGNIVNNNFTLCFWICMSGNSPFYLPKLCSFTDPKNKSSAFKIILSWDSLNIYFSNQQVEFECNFF
ncbi:hypothetical protein TRFO_02027 [Tritrichomonas foetus]|uniref:Uncharacterized protein n=1 Tax=Tritrichomonas foetus TaxID=1144522 RepID=A0A1J4JE39_9EUKA|nr:hypothetical protein TRFO_02027 [Tritrichomonas foetus]|eukprot:OHS96913.1 hypothetical protein TRFO_02027 [Tritrichomonas foetus]